MVASAIRFMGSDPPRCLPFIGVIARTGMTPADMAALCAASLFACRGPASPRPFDYTSYYEREMGRGLIRFWLVGAALAAVDSLVKFKKAAVALEDEHRDAAGGRIFNLDPGYITPLQMVLATTKALPQAVYLGDGVFALVELNYGRGGFYAHPWTYGDYAAAAASGEFEPWRETYLSLMKAQP